MESQKINRLKVVLVENGKTGKWLAEQVGKNEATVSRWCSNKMQPSLDMLVKIAGLLNVDPRQLINGGNNDWLWQRRKLQRKRRTPSILKPYCLTAATISVVAHRSMISAMWYLRLCFSDLLAKNLMMLKLRCASNVSTEELLMKRKSQDSLIPPLATKI